MEDPVARILPFIPAFLWAALLLYIGGRSTVPTVNTTLPLDKAAHFVMYGILGALATLGWLRARRSARPAPKLLWVLVLAMSVGLLDEVRQRSVPARSADIYDWLADAFGVAVASTLILRYTRQGSSNAV